MVEADWRGEVALVSGSCIDDDNGSVRPRILFFGNQRIAKLRRNCRDELRSGPEYARVLRLVLVVLRDCWKTCIQMTLWTHFNNGEIKDNARNRPYLLIGNPRPNIPADPVSKT